MHTLLAATVSNEAHDWHTHRTPTLDAYLAVLKLSDDATYSANDDTLHPAIQEAHHDLAVELADTLETLLGTLERYRDAALDDAYVYYPEAFSDAQGDEIDAHNEAVKDATPTVGAALATRARELHSPVSTRELERIGMPPVAWPARGAGLWL